MMDIEKELQEIFDDPLFSDVKPFPHHLSFSGMGWNCGRCMAMGRMLFFISVTKNI